MCPASLHRARRRRHLPLMVSGQSTGGMSGPTVVCIALFVETMEGAPCAVRCRMARTALLAVVDDVVASFRSMSNAKGMQMTDQEIRDTCWAPMLQKASENALTCADETFGKRALCFLAWAAFGGSIRDGDDVIIRVSKSGESTVVRRPRRWWRSNRCRLGTLPPTSMRV